MTNIKAEVNKVKVPLVVQINSKKVNLNLFKRTAYINMDDSFTLGHKLEITSNSENNKFEKVNCNVEIEDLNKFNENDIIQVMPDGNINFLWEKKLNPNDLTLFITNQCNANCIMCPQPPKKDEYSLLETNKIILKYLLKEDIKRIGITGGEPTLKSSDLKQLLSLSYKYYPEAKVDLLTNGKKLSNFDFAKQLSISNPNITYCISFPSDNEKDFNHILESKNIYSHVLKGIYNLAILKQNIELRIVITKQNYKRLLYIAEFIYRNFPFIYHITFMGMEVIGHAYTNYEKIKIEPNEFNENLLDAIQFLNRRNMHVSIYNIPYCLVDKRLWKFLRNSISAWKQNYKTECNLCIKRASCPGIFSTSLVSNYNIKPIFD